MLESTLEVETENKVPRMKTVCFFLKTISMFEINVIGHVLI